MPLLSFSERDHVAKLRDGRKQQTTRLPRKNPTKVGDTLNCYYKSRMEKSCNNCIVQNCAGRFQVVGNICSQHTNSFGKAKVLAVVQIQNIVNKYTDEIALTEWAQNDGFVNWQTADEWFTEKYGENWKDIPFETIFFRSCWDEDNCSECGHHVIGDRLLDWKSFDDRPGGELVPVGYRCSNCGNEEEF